MSSFKVIKATTVEFKYNQSSGTHYRLGIISDKEEKVNINLDDGDFEESFSREDAKLFAEAILGYLKATEPETRIR